MIPLCRALREARHPVLVAIAPNYTEAAREEGLDAAPAGPEWDFAHADRFVPGFTHMRPRDGMASMAAIAGRGIVDDVVEIAGEWNPDVILHGHHELGG